MTTWRTRLLAGWIVWAAALALPACEASPGEMFQDCAADGSCEGSLSCYTKEGILGYCTATCYGSIECPPEAVCHEGKCILICEDGGDTCPGGTICNLVEPPRGICQP